MNIYQQSAAGQIFNRPFKNVYGIAGEDVKPVLVEFVALMRKKIVDCPLLDSECPPILLARGGAVTKLRGHEQRLVGSDCGTNPTHELTETRS